MLLIKINFLIKKRISYFFFVTGELFLYQDSDNSSLIISGVVSNVAPDGLHGFHVHQFGNLSDSCKGAGPHFNPDGVGFLECSFKNKNCAEKAVGSNLILS